MVLLRRLFLAVIAAMLSALAVRNSIQEIGCLDASSQDLVFSGLERPRNISQHFCCICETNLLEQGC